MAFSLDLAGKLMLQALDQANIAYQLGEVPVGAVVARLSKDSFEIISSAHNLVENQNQAAAHAEMLALRDASNKLGRWRLEDCVLCVTLEPCMMCAGALRLARIGGVIFGADDQRMGAFGSRMNLAQTTELGPLPKVLGGVEYKRCSELIKRFFKELRERNALLSVDAAGELH